jgi:hypothetical protein
MVYGRFLGESLEMIARLDPEFTRQPAMQIVEAERLQVIGIRQVEMVGQGRNEPMESVMVTGL